MFTKVIGHEVASIAEKGIPVHVLCYALYTEHYLRDSFFKALQGSVNFIIKRNNAFNVL